MLNATTIYSLMKEYGFMKTYLLFSDKCIKLAQLGLVSHAEELRYKLGRAQQIWVDFG